MGRGDQIQVRVRVRVRVRVLIGMQIIPAYRVALISGVAISGPDPDVAPPLHEVIHAQQPAAGTAAWSGDTVTVFTTAATQPENSSPARPGQHVTAGRHRRP